MVIVILSTMETVDIGNHLVLLLAMARHALRRANRRMSMTILLLLLRITLVLIAAPMTPHVGNHHASAQANQFGIPLRPDVMDGMPPPPWATLLSQRVLFGEMAQDVLLQDTMLMLAIPGRITTLRGGRIPLDLVHVQSVSRER